MNGQLFGFLASSLLTHEIDFVFSERGKTDSPIGIECKWKANHFEPGGAKAFAYQYPQAEIYVVAFDVTKSFTKKFGELRVNFVSLAGLISRLLQTRD